MKKHLNYEKTTLGLLLVLCAVVIILDALGIALGFFNGISATTLIFGSIVLVWFITNLIKLKIPKLFLPLAILFILFEKHIASALSLNSSNIIDNWIVILVAILLECGFSMLIPKRTKKFRFHKSFYIDTDSGNSTNEFNTDSSNSTKETFNENNEEEGSSHHKYSMSSSTVYIDCTTFISETVSNEMGSCDIYFTNVDKYAGNGVLTVFNRLGSMDVHVPSDWAITNAVGNSLGSVDSPQNTSNGGPSILIKGSNELGSLDIIYE